MAASPKKVVGGILPRFTDPKVRRRYRLKPTPLGVPSTNPVTASWAWSNEAGGTVQWTFTNNTANQLSFILLRNGYYFGNAFFPVYDANSSFRTGFASSLSSLAGSGATDPPLGVVGFAQPDGSWKYIASFVFTLAGNSSWSMTEGGFSAGNPPSGITPYVVTLRGAYETCIGYDQQQVTQYDNQTKGKDPGYTPNPSVFNVVVMEAPADATYIVLYPNDSITNYLKFGAIMAPADQTWWWYFGIDDSAVSQYLQQNKAQLTNLSAYLDLNGALHFTAIMEPLSGTGWWWYFGLTGDQVGQMLTRNKAVLTDISAYVDTDKSVKFAVIMVANTGQEWWWYFGVTGAQVGELLTQNNAMLSKLSPYWDTDGSLKFAAIMKPLDGQAWWWYWGQTGAEVQTTLGSNNAQLTDLASYLDPSDDSIKFAVIMTAKTGSAWWWWWGEDSDEIVQAMSANKARLTLLTPFFSCG